VFRIFLSQTPCVICRGFRSEFNGVRAFALISHSRFYTKSCSQIATFWELTERPEGRTFKLALLARTTSHPRKASLQAVRPTLTEECHLCVVALPAVRHFVSLSLDPTLPSHSSNPDFPGGDV